MSNPFYYKPDECIPTETKATPMEERMSNLETQVKLLSEDRDVLMNYIHVIHQNIEELQRPVINQEERERIETAEHNIGRLGYIIGKAQKGIRPECGKGYRHEAVSWKNTLSIQEVKSHSNQSVSTFVAQQMLQLNKLCVTP